MMWTSAFLVTFALMTLTQGGPNVPRRLKVRALLTRLNEPVFTPKLASRIILDVPQEFVVKRFSKLAEEVQIQKRQGSTTVVPIKPIKTPDITEILELSRDSSFSIFIPRHMELLNKLVDLFMAARTFDDLFSLAVYCRDRVNSMMFIYAFCQTIVHRSDTKDLQCNLPDIFPQLFVRKEVFDHVQSRANLRQQMDAIDIPPTGNTRDPEYRVAYFREDIGLNVHHWHWHLVYPTRGNFVNKDRRGELFYYMHTQAMARYNFERLGNQLSRVKPLHDFRVAVAEGYFSKLAPILASVIWGTRQANTFLQDIDRPGGSPIEIQLLERWRESVYEAIYKKRFEFTNGTIASLDNDRGIDILGNMVEASTLTPNPTVYGNLHNQGHNVISVCQDPDGSKEENPGVMSETATAMRDPIFYRWHTFIDNIFTEHKKLMPAYTASQLDFSNVVVGEVSLQTSGEAPNVLSTFYETRAIDLSSGLDFSEDTAPVLVNVVMLNHRDFTYRVRVRNSGAERQGTVRIFLAPKYDERGEQFTFEEQRRLFVLLDAFVVTLRAGDNVISRSSVDSVVTIPFEQTYDQIDISDLPTDAQNYCKCGWPHNLLIPKGTTAGMPAQLFVMISNYANDRVTQPDQPDVCKDSMAYCGLRGQRYPDRRPMGYPLDRTARVRDIAEFLTQNMAVADVTILFTEGPRRQSAPKKQKAPPPVFMMDDRSNSCAPCTSKVSEQNLVKLPGKYYYYFSNTLAKATWYEGRAICRSRDMELASIESASENAAISSYAASIMSGPYSFWTGGSDEERANVWTWSSGDPFSYKNWDEDEPSNSRDENCLSVGRQKLGQGKWSDSQCSEKKQIICKVKECC